ncbi:hypothetical protein C0992_002595, partial [Termitomyces sp. T32_za158]
AAKAYEDHVATNGKPDSHAKAKEIMYGFKDVELPSLLCTYPRTGPGLPVPLLIVSRRQRV